MNEWTGVYMILQTMISVIFSIIVCNINVCSRSFQIKHLYCNQEVLRIVWFYLLVDCSRGIWPVQTRPFEGRSADRGYDGILQYSAKPASWHHGVHCPLSDELSTWRRAVWCQRFPVRHVLSSPTTGTVGHLSDKLSGTMFLILDKSWTMFLISDKFWTMFLISDKSGTMFFDFVKISSRKKLLSIKSKGGGLEHIFWQVNVVYPYKHRYMLYLGSLKIKIFKTL